MVKMFSCGIFPTPFPDETCYSLLCRYAVRRGRFTSNQICMDLFGHTEPLAGYLFKPFRVKDLERWFAGRDIEALPEYGMKHSFYPFCTAFLNPYDAEKVRTCRSGSVLNLTGSTSRKVDTLHTGIERKRTVPLPPLSFQRCGDCPQAFQLCLI